MKEIYGRIGSKLYRNRYVLLILSLGLILRLIYLWEIKDNPFFDTPIIDAESYDDWAKEILSGNLIWDEIKIHGPLYPFFLAFIYKLFGQNYFGVYLVQHVMGTIACLFIYLVATKVFSRIIGLIALAIAATYWTFIYFEGQLLTESLVLFLDILIVYLLLRAGECRSSLRWMIAGLILGLSLTGRGNLLIFIPLVLIWIAQIYWPQRQLKSAAIAVICFIVSVIPPLATLAAINYLSYSDMILIQPNMGLNFFLGNNPAADGLPSATPGNKWRAVAALPAKAGINKPSEQDRYYISKSVHFILDEPFSFLKLLLKKSLLFWNYYDIDASQDIHLFRDWSVLSEILLFDYRFVSPLALLGLCLLAPQISHWRIKLLYFFITAYFFSVIAFVTSARYRLPAIPVLIIFSAYSVDYLWKSIKTRKLSPILLFFLLVGFFGILTNIDYFDLKNARVIRTEYNLGSVYNRKADYDRALVELKKAVKIEPAEMDVHIQLGLAYAGKGIMKEAIKEFEIVVHNSDYYIDKAIALGYLGKIYQIAEKPNKALAAFKAALTLTPKDAELHYNLGTVYRSLGRKDAALEAYQHSARLKPDWTLPKRKIAELTQ